VRAKRSIWITRSSVGITCHCSSWPPMITLAAARSLETEAPKA
jgi:hypothetical protein